MKVFGFGAMALALALSGVACSDKTEERADETARAAGATAESAAEDAQRNAQNAGNATENAAERTGDALERAGDATADAAKDAGNAIKDAAKDAGRATDAAVQTADVKAALVADSRVDAGGIDVDTNADTKTVVLKGHVPTAAQKTIAAQIAADHAKGYSIRNELTVRS